ncbi:MAG: DedA family protein [Bellilinea sp.]
MDWIRLAFDFVLHIDRYLDAIIRTVGLGAYGVLFLIIFIETGLVVTPFLPGDSLLFAAGAFSAKGSLSVLPLWLLLMAAAVIGDSVNYWIGNKVGSRVFERESRWVKREYLERTQKFYEKHGGKTILLARFVPIVRTFAPFVAGIGKMRYGYFLTYNIVGGTLWVSLFLWGGYFFGGLPFVEKNFSLVIVAIVLISVLPAVWETLKAQREKRVPAVK